MLITVRRRDSGFTLVETLAALVVFGLVTLGIVPLIAASLRGSNYARTSTVAKNLVTEGIERARGLPFRREVSGANGFPKKVDLLDLYFPRGFGGSGADGVYASNVFTVTCTSTSEAPACPKQPDSAGNFRSAVPAGYTLVFRAEFVQAVAGAGGETYTTTTLPQSPDPLYYWQGNASTPTGACTNCTSQPPSDLLRLTVTARWSAAGVGERAFSTTSILGDRRFTGLRLRGEASVGYVIEMSTGFSSPTQGDTSLVVTAGSAESDHEVRAVTRARYSGSAARLLVRDNTAPLAPDVDVVGASYADEAPADFVRTVADSKNAQTAGWFDLGTVAGMDATRISNAEGGVAVDRPQARGTVEIRPTTALGLLWVAGQTDPADNPLRILDGSGARRVAWIEAFPGTATSTPAVTSQVESLASATSAGSRQVANVASGAFHNLRMFPTDFIPAENGGGPVIEIRDFESEVACTASRSANTPTASASATWSAGLRVWTELDPNDGAVGTTAEPAGSYTDLIPLDQDGGADALADIGNPMVWEEPDSAEGLSPEQQGRPPADIYLFPETRDYRVIRDGEVVEVDDHQHAGYLETWSASAGTSATADGRRATASLDGVLRISSMPLGPSGLSSVKVTLGRLNCESLDLRP